jgi:L-aspartate oxidase
MKHSVTDFLIIGSGVAGLQAALEAARSGKVLIVTKGPLKESSSGYAQGGVAVALRDEQDIESHYQDTIRSGNGLCRPEAVRILVEEGAKCIRQLIARGAQFDKKGRAYAWTREAAHSRDRILRAHGDATGEEIVKTLVRQVAAKDRISTLPHTFSLDLIVIDGICRGAVVMDQRKKTVSLIWARAVVLATGGAGQLFARTTNPAVATGDGMAIAFRAGAALEDMEFVQFHPTSLCLSGAPAILLSEAMRGEGAVLKNTQGEAFMSHYHPAKELAPRDIVARAIWREMQKTRSSHVYLDLTHLGLSFVRKRFPTSYRACQKFNLDLARDPIPVAPSAHFIMGGVKTDLNGATRIPGLYAAGEAACVGVHGANRLASNSLLEGLVFGQRAGKAAVRHARNTGTEPVRFFRLPDYSGKTSPVETMKVRADLQECMWEQVGIVRTKESLIRALRALAAWLDQKCAASLSQPEIELNNMLTVAQLIALAAKLRTGSIGAHYREDYPQKGRGWKVHWVLGRERTTVCTEPGRLDRLPDGRGQAGLSGGLVHYDNLWAGSCK